MVTIDPFLEARADFPTAQRLVYADVASRGILSNSVRETITAYLDDLQANGGDKDRWLEEVENARRKVARLLSADVDEIAFVKNVSEGLNAVINALEWRAGDNVVVAGEVEHPNNIYPWLNLQRRGVEVRVAPTQRGLVDVDAFAARIDDRTRAVTVAAVTFVPGGRTDLKQLAALCRPRGIFLMVDAAQAAGVMHLDVKDLDVDGLTASSSKGLLGLYGFGFLYCRRDWCERMQPAYLARYSVDVGAEHEEVMGGFDYQLAAGARRFDIGNFNYLAACALSRSLDLLLEIGTEAIERHVLDLSGSLTRHLDDLGLHVWSGRGPTLSHIVCAGEWAAGHYDGGAEALALHQALADAGIRLTIRRGMLRFAFHLYNTPYDVGRIAEVVAAAVGSSQSR